jgi:hypothetical protein
MLFANVCAAAAAWQTDENAATPLKSRSHFGFVTRSTCTPRAGVKWKIDARPRVLRKKGKNRVCSAVRQNAACCETPRRFLLVLEMSIFPSDVGSSENVFLVRSTVLDMFLSGRC